MAIFSDILNQGDLKVNPLNDMNDVERKIADTGELTSNDAEKLMNEQKKVVFPKLEGLNLTEYSADSAYEEYTGIVLDPEDRIFKTVSGQFHDKKDFYEKLTDRGYVVRKVFEKRVFDWIEENAKTTLEAYLMFSTAFSKWKGNNLLDPYYVKLLNDIPQLNREKVKGDPNSMGTQKEESVLEEEDLQHLDNDFVQTKHTVTITPKDDPANELEIKNVRLNSSLLGLLNQYKELNKEAEYNNTLDKILRSSREFLQSMGDAVRPLNRDQAFKFYNPKYDNKSNLYIPELNKTNPNIFNIKIDGETVTNFDDTPYELKKTSIINWYNNFEAKNKIANSNNNDITNAFTINQTNKELAQQNSSFELLNAAADLQRFTELSSDIEENEKELNRILGNLTKANPKWKAKVSSYKKFGVTDEEHAKALEFSQDLRDMVSKDLTPDERKLLQLKYGSENQIDAINTLKNQEYNFYEELGKNLASRIPTTIDDKIKWLEEYIKNFEETDLSDNQTKLETLINLRTSLDTLKSKAKAKKAFNKKPSTNNLPGYNLSTEIPADLPRTGTINQPKGAKAKHTISQDQLGINQGIHSFNKKESTWSNLINELKETHIPVVDDILPIKQVNYGADQLDSEIPVDGVITNPGVSFQTGGTFITEDENVDPQWDNRAHDVLNQDLFEGTHLRPEVREALLRIAGKFQNTLGLSIKPVDVYLTGSSANFNYNELSDIDLHLVYDFEQIGINAEILIKYFIAKKQVFNNDYEITAKGMPVEVGVENINEPIVSSAIYSLTQDRWMLEPKDAEHLLPKPDMKQYYEIVQRIEDAIESRNSKRIGDLWDELYRLRKDSLKVDGEYGHGNGLFKKLRNLGYLDRLKHAYYSSASEELSLEALKEII